jgi:hypothetical protein
LKLTTSELVYINEAAKALKQKDFIIIDNAIIGIDNIQSIVTYILLDTNFIINYYNGLIINQRALSAFVKTLSIESDFEFDSINNTIRSISGGELTLMHNLQIAELARDKYLYAITLDNNTKTIIPETEVPDIMEKIQNMNKADGSIGINYNGYYMTLFPSLLPTTKTDKMYVKIMQPHMQTYMFFAKFRISKKKFDIITYINFIKV